MITEHCVHSVNNVHPDDMRQEIDAKHVREGERTAGLAQGTAVPQAGRSAEPGTGCTPAVAALVAARVSAHLNVTGGTAAALNSNDAPRPDVDADTSVSTGRVVSTVNSWADTRA